MNLLQRWKTDFRFYRLFFFSTLKLSVLFCLLFAWLGISVSHGGVLDFIKLWIRLIPFMGLGCDYIYKELTRKEEYFFYYNQGISKLHLWIVTFLLSYVSCSLLNKIVQLCADALK